MKLFYFVSSKGDDEVKRLTIGTTTIKRAYALAQIYFAKHKCKGVPQMLYI